MIEFSKESEMVPMGTSRKSGDLTWNDPYDIFRFSSMWMWVHMITPIERLCLVTLKFPSLKKFSMEILITQSNFISIQNKHLASKFI